MAFLSGSCVNYRRILLLEVAPFLRRGAGGVVSTMLGLQRKVRYHWQILAKENSALDCWGNFSRNIKTISSPALGSLPDLHRQRH